MLNFRKVRIPKQWNTADVEHSVRRWNHEEVEGLSSRPHCTVNFVSWNKLFDELLFCSWLCEIVQQGFKCYLRFLFFQRNTKHQRMQPDKRVQKDLIKGNFGENWFWCFEWKPLVQQHVPIMASCSSQVSGTRRKTKPGPTNKKPNPAILIILWKSQVFSAGDATPSVLESCNQSSECTFDTNFVEMDEIIGESIVLVRLLRLSGIWKPFYCLAQNISCPKQSSCTWVSTRVCTRWFEASPNNFCASCVSIAGQDLDESNRESS